MNIRRIVTEKALKHGIDLGVMKQSFKPKNDTWYKQNLDEFLSQRGEDTTFEVCVENPYLNDRHDEGGTMYGAYFHQDLLVARLIHSACPRTHVDIGSRTDGFVAHVASFRKIELIDIRPIRSSVRNVIFRQADLMKLPDGLKSYTDSISSLHAIEHFGLGRYGDPVDYWGYIKALDNIYEMLERCGTFYFSVPIGPQRIEFNAHRVFSVQHLLDVMLPKYDVASLSIINDAGELFEDVRFSEPQIANNYGCNYGCGVFVLRKK